MQTLKTQWSKFQEGWSTALYLSEGSNISKVNQLMQHGDKK